ncbi:MAG: hypothetical protein RLZZ15_1299, partial [Verrucomicrobiota bacterium]
MAVIRLAPVAPVIFHPPSLMPIVSFFRSVACARGLFFAAWLVFATAALAQSPSAADGFDPNVDGNVYALAAQPDGKLILGGQFAVLRPGIGIAAGRDNLARLNADGSVDLAFAPNPNAPIRALALQPDGKLLVAGDFTSIGGAPRNRLARLNADGSLDTAFNPSIGGAVNALLLLPDGRIVIGGAFTTVGTTTRNRLARLSTTGALDAAFDPNVNNVVFALGLHGGGKLLVGGGFTRIGTSDRGRMARLNPDGTVDSEFNAAANNVVTAIAVQRDGHILFGGAFTTVQPFPTPTPQSRSHLARLQADGQFDSAFNANVGGDVNALVIQPDGSILVGGAFASAWSAGAAPSGRGNLARFSADGALDVAFAPFTNQTVAALAIFPDARLAVGGYFTRVASRNIPAGIIRNRLARLNLDGTIDATFAPEDGGRPLVTAVQADGKVLLGGTFTSVGGVTRNFLARVNADSTLDLAFNPNLNGRVLALAVQGDGKILVAGSFTTVTGGAFARTYFTRLNADGSVDGSFNPTPNGEVNALAIQADGKILIGGAFTGLTPNGATTTTTRNHIARLNAADGTVDTPFDPSAFGNVLALAIQSDGKIVLGGAFTTLQPNGARAASSRSGLARVNADGTLDTAFNPFPNGAVTSLALQSDGKLLVGG